MHSILSRIAFLLRKANVCIVIILVTLEISLRVLAPFSSTVRLALWSPNNGFQYDFIRTVEDIPRFLPGMWKPGSYHAGYPLNEYGFRTAPYEGQKKDTVLRVVVIGDSFTFSSGGVPHESMWHQVAGRALGEAVGRPVEVISLGLPGAGPRLTRRVLQVAGLELQPDIVVYGLFIGNDFTDEVDTRSWLQSMSYTARFLSSLTRLPAQLKLLQEYGGLFQPASKAFEPSQYRYDRDVKNFDDEQFISIETRRGELLSHSQGSRLEPLVTDVADVVAGMRKDASSVGATFVTILIPDEVQVSAPLRASVDSILIAKGGAPVDAEGAQSLVLDYLQTRDIQSIDLLPALKKEAEKFRSPYRSNDTHWDERGNEIAGMILAEFLASLQEPKEPISSGKTTMELAPASSSESVSMNATSPKSFE